MIRYTDVGDDGRVISRLDAVKIGIRNLLSTRPGELGHDLDFGCNIPDFLFEECNEDTAFQLELMIKECLKQEKRIRVEKLDITPVPDEHKFIVRLIYSIPELEVQDTIELELSK